MVNHGLVAFFDVLGYQNLINNNAIIETCDIIKDLFLELPVAAKQKISNVFSEAAKELQDAGDIVIDLQNKTDYIQNILKSIESVVISDSIIVFLPFDLQLKDWFKVINFVIYAAYITELLSSSFEKKLPLRGAIDFGEYYLNNNCFAGKSIINSYKEAESCNFSGCILTGEAERKITEWYESCEIPPEACLKVVGHSYLCPMNDGSYRKAFLFNWGQVLSNQTDIRQFVFEAFTGHNKDIGKGVIEKMDNTELMLRLFRNRNGKNP